MLSFSLPAVQPSLPLAFSPSASGWLVDSFYCLLPAGILSEEHPCCGQAMCGRTCCRGEPNAAESHKHLFKPIDSVFVRVRGLSWIYTFVYFLKFTRKAHSVLPVKIKFGYELTKLYTFNNNYDNIYNIIPHESREHWAEILCLGFGLRFTIITWRFELVFGTVLSFTESNLNIFQMPLREGVRRNTNLLIGFVFCHYATAKHVCAKNTQEG